jgi:hypothetical protein
MLLNIKENAITRTLKVVLIIPLCVFLALALCSLLVRYNVITMILYYIVSWFVILPGIILYLSSKLLRKEHRVWKAMVSMITFYGFMVFMIYKHYATDFFMLMMISFLWNSGVMITVMLVERDDSISGKNQNFSQES